MNREQQFQRYLRLCQRIYERMEAENSWPWKTEDPDSTDPEDLVESEDNENNI